MVEIPLDLDETPIDKNMKGLSILYPSYEDDEEEIPAADIEGILTDAEIKTETDMPWLNGTFLSHGDMNKISRLIRDAKYIEKEYYKYKKGFFDAAKGAAESTAFLFKSLFYGVLKLVPENFDPEKFPEVKKG